jgi:hypothetical protein
MKCETYGGLSFRRSSSDMRGNITRYQDFTNISIPYFDKGFAEKKDLCSTAEQKQKCLEIAALLKQRFNFGSQAFLYQIVAIDKLWVRDFGPELKWHSNEWRSPNSPQSKKF